MSTTANFDQIGFLNSILPLNQTNWADYFHSFMADGVIGGAGDELEVYANSAGMVVHVKTGWCFAHSHKGKLTSAVDLTIEDADVSYPRIDLVVARVTYGNPSTMVLAVKAGTPAASPAAPSATQTAGDVWEVPLAKVSVAANAVTIAASDVSDMRFIHRINDDFTDSFSGTTLTVKNQREYRCTAASLASLAISVPKYPNNTFICSVVFNSGSSFSGVTLADSAGTSITPKILGDALTLTSKRYTLVIWWDGSYWMVASKAV